MSDGTKIPRGWKAVRQQLAVWDKPALLVLLKELYDAAGVNRDLVDARCHPDEEFSGATLEKYRGKIVQQFFPSRGFGALKLGEARKTIRKYCKVTGNLPGTVDLLMTYVENGTRFTREYGDINERFYDSMESALQELANLLRAEARDLYPQVRERLAQMGQMAAGIGWGYGDFVTDLVYRLKEELGNPQS